jgi:hypothetical protein
MGSMRSARHSEANSLSRSFVTNVRSRHEIAGATLLREVRILRRKVKPKQTLDHV